MASESEKIETLLQMFPASDSEVCGFLLQENKGDLEQTIQQLLQMSDNQTQDIVQSATTTPIDQLLKDEAFAKALALAIEQEESDRANQQQSRQQKKTGNIFTVCVEQPKSGTSSNNNSSQNLKEKWNQVSEATKEKAQQIYLKLTSIAKPNDKSKEYAPLMMEQEGTFLNEDSELEVKKSPYIATSRSVYSEHTEELTPRASSNLMAFNAKGKKIDVEIPKSPFLETQSSSDFEHGKEDLQAKDDALFST